jgi:hypothetical protein
MAPKRWIGFRQFRPPAIKFYEIFRGNFSVTLSPPATSVTQTFPISGKLFPYATQRQTKREHRGCTINEGLQKALYPWA